MPLRAKQTSLDWALTHIEKFGDTDIFPIPFEYKAIRHGWDRDLRYFLSSQDLRAWEARSFRRLLTPKNRFGFRIATQLDPLDCILFTSLILEMGEDIEEARLPKTDKISFSYRFKPDANGRLYDEKYNWVAFQHYCKHLVESNKYRFVVLADVADFYPRIYSHPLKNSLSELTKKRDHVECVSRFLMSWNFTVSYGIPVGPSACRILAELVLDDIDRGLLAENAIFCRYVDDYRIFCKSEREAYERLSFLANILYENQGLTLQQNKTTIMPIEVFEQSMLETEERKELGNLAERMKELIEDLGIEDNPYEEVEYDDLSDEQRTTLNELNLVDILVGQINSNHEPDNSILRFVLRRLGQFGNTEPVDLILDNIDKLYPVFKDVVKYIQELRSINATDRKSIGERLLKILDKSVAAHLEYHRIWIAETFTQGDEWDNSGKFVSLYNQFTDEGTRRKLILAMGRSHQTSWFKAKKRSIKGMAPWERRAFLAAASCLPGDEYKHWFQSIRNGLDPLERAVGRWAKDNRF